MRAACTVAGKVLDDIIAFIKPGVTTNQVDGFAAERIKFYGGKSAFLGYRKYPCHTCISVNEEVVHGLQLARPGFDRLALLGCFCGQRRPGL